MLHNLENSRKTSSKTSKKWCFLVKKVQGTAKKRSKSVEKWSKSAEKRAVLPIKNAKNTAKTELYIYAFSVSNTKDFHVIQDAVLPFDHEKRAFLVLRTTRKVHFASIFEPLLPYF